MSEVSDRAQIKTGTSEIVCTECKTVPRLKSLRKNSGTCVGCSCDGVRYSLDSVPYELGIHDLPEEWIVVEGRSARQMALEVDLCIDGDVYKCPRCEDEFGLKEAGASCSKCGYIPENNRWLPEDNEDRVDDSQELLTDGGACVDETERIDKVEETWRNNQMGVKVERVVRSGYEKDQKLLKVYGLRKDRYRSLDGDGTKEVERDVKIAEFPSEVATEVLFGLAEAHGYELEGK